MTTTPSGRRHRAHRFPGRHRRVHAAFTDDEYTEITRVVAVAVAFAPWYALDVTSTASRGSATLAFW